MFSAISSTSCDTRSARTPESATGNWNDSQSVILPLNTAALSFSPPRVSSFDMERMISPSPRSTCIAMPSMDASMASFSLSMSSALSDALS